MSRNGCSRVLLFILTVMLCGIASAQEVVNYGVQPTLTPVHLLRPLGYLDAIERKHNVRIAFKSFQTGAPQNQAMAAGEIQISSAGMGPAVVAASRLPATLLAVTVLGQTAVITHKDSPAKTIKDLKGKRIAFPGEGSQQYPLILKALADNGLTVRDVELFKTNGAGVTTLVEQRDVEAGIVWDPFISQALAGGKARLLARSDEIMPIKQGNYLGNGEYARLDFVEKRPELVQDIIEAHVKAIDFIQREPAKAAKLWAKELGMDEKIINFSLTERISVFNRNVVPEAKAIQTYVEFLKKGGILEASDNPKVEPKFSEKALAVK
jgi:ABC-type nitrate/sulfonate/bicarbonate transport system substrate-binding protein